MKAIKKFFKFIFGLIVTIVVVAILLVLTIPFWIGPVAKTAANRTVPGITGTDFRLDRFEFNFYTGKLCIGDMTLSNPEGYRPDEAFTLGKFNVDVDVGSLFEDTIVVHEIALRDLFVSYVKKDGVYNFDVIADNIAQACGGEEEAEQPSAGGEGGEQRKIEIEIPQPKDDKQPKGEGEPEGEKKPKGEAAEKKVIIDRIVISGLKLQWGSIPVPVPFTLTLKDIGRDEGGVSFATAGREIFEQVMRQLGAVGQGLVNLGEAGLSAATNSLNAVSGALAESSAAIAVAATNSVDSLQVMTTNTVDVITSALKDGTGATIDTTAGALKATGNATVDTLKATGNTAVDTFKATGESLKAAGKELKATGKDLKNMFKNKK